MKHFNVLSVRDSVETGRDFQDERIFGDDVALMTSVACDAMTSVASDMMTSVAVDAMTSVATDAMTSVATDAMTSVATAAMTSVARDGVARLIGAQTSLMTSVA